MTAYNVNSSVSVGVNMYDMALGSILGLTGFSHSIFPVRCLSAPAIDSVVVRYTRWFLRSMHNVDASTEEASGDDTPEGEQGAAVAGSSNGNARGRFEKVWNLPHTIATKDRARSIVASWANNANVMREWVRKPYQFYLYATDLPPPQTRPALQ